MQINFYFEDEEEKYEARVGYGYQWWHEAFVMGALINKIHFEVVEFNGPKGTATISVPRKRIRTEWIKTEKEPSEGDMRSFAAIALKKPSAKEVEYEDLLSGSLI